MRYTRLIYNFFYDIYKNRELLISLTKNDFKSRYLTNYLGVLWAFIQPAVTILVLWFVFQVGFKSQPVENVPFILWLIAGMIPWFFISEAVMSGTSSVLENSFLVKKIVFRVSLLPMVKLSSALAVHIFFLFFMLGMYALHGFLPHLYWLQIFYYLFCSIVLLLGFTWFSASVVVFFRDLGQVINVALQIAFWGTPIFWSLKMIPEKYHFFFKVNPVYYITQGYRDTLIDHVWFWEKPKEMLLFWGVTLLVVFFGAYVFKKLRPHFSDVL